MSHSEFSLSNKCPWPKQIPAIKIYKKKRQWTFSSKPRNNNKNNNSKVEIGESKAAPPLSASSVYLSDTDSAAIFVSKRENKNVSFCFEFFQQRKPSENLLAPPHPPLHSPTRLHFILVNKQQQKERQKTEKLAPKLTFTWQRVKPFGGWCCYSRCCCCCCYSFWGMLT